MSASLRYYNKSLSVQKSCNHNHRLKRTAGGFIFPKFCFSNIKDFTMKTGPWPDNKNAQVLHARFTIL